VHTGGVALDSQRATHRQIYEHQLAFAPHSTGAVSPLDEKPGKPSVFSEFVGLVDWSVEIGLTKKRRLLRECGSLSDNTNTHSGKDTSMHDRNPFSLFW
jgi:hypothetical protein